MHFQIILFVYNIMHHDLLGTLSAGLVFVSQGVAGPPGFPSPLLTFFKKENL